MPCDYRDYHPDWKSIVHQIKDQADNRCEFCGVANHAYGARDILGEWHDEDDIDSMNVSFGESIFGEYPTMIRIVLTVAHLDHDRTHNDPANLRALCQKCHLNWDRARHIANAAETRRRKRLEQSGQMVML